MSEWRDHVKTITDRLKLVELFGQEAVFDAEGAKLLGDLLKEMADRLDAIKAQAHAMAALRVGFRE